MKKYLIAFGAVVVVALMLVSIADGQKPLTDVQEVTVTCVVRPGDTLWNIAEGFMDTVLVQKIITLFSTEYRRITKSFLLMVASYR